MTFAWCLAAVLVSGAVLLVLGACDPKRRRVRGLGTTMTPGQRQLATAVVLLPGGVLAFAAARAALLVWIGGTTVIGWSIATLLAERPARA